MTCENQSDQCKEASDDYDAALQDLQDIKSDMEEAKDWKVTGTAVAGTGTAGLLLAAGAIAAGGGPPGWLIGGGVALFALGAGIWGAGQSTKSSRRKDCKAARKRMWDAYKLASGQGGCTDKDCEPPRPTQSC